LINRIVVLQEQNLRRECDGGLFRASIVRKGADMFSRSRRMDFAGRVVLITGGSRGLGLILARRFRREGSRIALLARSADELDRAATALDPQRAKVLPVVCDITRPRDVADAVEIVMRHFGRIDVLINNAGVIQVGPIEHMNDEDFQRAMAVHFWGSLHTIQAVLPQMRQRRSGRIVNISSIGGLVAVPHLGPYTASKFALTGLSDALRAEVRKDGIKVTTVCPGLMRTGSAIHALVKGRHQAEFAWFATLSAMPLIAIDADRAARKIVAACRTGVPHLTITPQARLMAMLDRLMPNTMARVMAASVRALPAPDGREGYDSWPGLVSRPASMPKWLTALGDRAARRNNELAVAR
jgi:NAD(P)-dependent dehydrogenase (short-subunit alcohol dehydrogenase family)